jgi:hypothetical protein
MIMKRSLAGEITREHDLPFRLIPPDEGEIPDQMVDRVQLPSVQCSEENLGIRERARLHDRYSERYTEIVPVVEADIRGEKAPARGFVNRRTVMNVFWQETEKCPAHHGRALGPHTW